jgi:two-component system, LytTR family, response regulator
VSGATHGRDRTRRRDSVRRGADPRQEAPTHQTIAENARSLRALIVDDERLGRERLVTLLAREPGIEIVGQCDNGVAALQAITHATPDHSPDLVFLDVQMPDLDGLEVAQSLVGMAAEIHVPEVIFVTAFSEYMERAFELHAVDYLRKPYTDARFASALAHVRSRIADRRAAELGASRHAESSKASPALVHRTAIDPARLKLLLDAVAADQPRRRIALRDRATGTLTLVDASEVAWVEADGPGRVVLHGHGKPRPWPRGIESAESELAPLGFIRVHRSYLVHPDHLVEIKELPKGQYMLTLPGGKQFDTGRTYAANMERLLASIPGGL